MVGEIRRIIDSDTARDFLNSVPFDEYVPELFPVCNEQTLILGWFQPNLTACFPCQLFDGHIEVHVAAMREFRGKTAVAAGRAAIAWIFENTAFDRIVGSPNSREAAVNAYLCGMRRNGVIFEISRWADL